MIGKYLDVLLSVLMVIAWLYIAYFAAVWIFTRIRR